MNKIEMMYKNVGISKRKLCTSEMSICTMHCETCSDYTYSYPPFTAEKQLNVLKVIVYSFGFNALDKPIWDKGWDIAIARLVNIYWEVLMEKEKRQIREILK